MASEGPPKKDTPVTVNAPTIILPQQTSDAPSNNLQQTSVSTTSDVPAHLAATLTATGIGGVPIQEVQTKGSTPSPLASVSSTDLTIAMQERAKAQYNAISMQLAMGQGEFKLILPFLPEIAVAVTKRRAPEEEMGKLKQMFDSECAQLHFLSSKGLPALRIHGNVFIIDRNKSGIKYAMLMDAIPKHTFIDAKDPATIKTFLPSILLDVEIPRGEAWYMKRALIEEQIQKKLLDPGVIDIAKKKAALLQQQLKEISAILDKENIHIVDLQLLVDERGKITIIDPLDVVSPTATKGVYRSVINGESISNPDFTKKIQGTKEMLTAMISFCTTVATTTNPKELKSLITPSLDPSVMAGNTLEGPSPYPSTMVSRARPMGMGYESKSGHMALGTIDEVDPDFSTAVVPRPTKLGLGAGKPPLVPRRPPSSEPGQYRPSSRAQSVVFSPMPPAIPLPTNATTDALKKDPTPTQSATKDTSDPSTTTVAKDPKDKPPDPSAGGKKPGSPTF